MKYYCIKNFNYFNNKFSENEVYKFKNLYRDDLLIAHQFENKYGFFDIILNDEFKEYFIEEKEYRKMKLTRLNILSQK